MDKNKIKELRDKLGILQTDLDEIGKRKKNENRNFTKTELEQIDEKIAKQETIIAELRSLGFDIGGREDITKSQGLRLPYENENTESRPLEKIGRCGGIVGATCYNDVFGRREDLNDDGFQDMGEFMRALRSGFSDKRLRYGRNEIIVIPGKEKRVALEGVPSDGGFFVPETFGVPIVDNMIRAGEIIKRCQIFGLQASNTIKVPAWKIPDHSGGATHTFAGGLVVSRMNESGQTTATSPKVRQIQMTLNKLTALVTASNELIADSPQYSQYLTKLISDALSYVTEYEIVNGSGAGEILGLINSPSKITVSKETGQDADTIVLENVYAMLKRFWRGFKNPVWLANPDCEEQLKTLVVGTSGDLARWSYDNANLKLEGYPIIFTEHCPALGASGDLSLTDLSTFGLSLASGQNIQIAASEHLKFDYDEIMFRGVYRNDGQSLFDEVYTPKHGTTKSNIVVIQARA